jgi:hypothetical protein
MTVRWLAAVALSLCIPPRCLAERRPGPIEVGFDARVELVAVVFYLAGNKEFSQCTDAAYLQAVERQFGPARSHPVVAMASEMRERKRVWFGSPVSLAVHLTPELELQPGVAAQADGGSLDFRWTLEEAREFARRLRDFSRATRAPEFFRRESARYERIVARMEAVTARIDAGWYEALAPARVARSFTVVPSLLSAHGNYGPVVRTTSGVRNYAVIGVWKFEPDGSPVFDEDVLALLAHEFAHPYVNPWVDAGMAGLRPAGEALIRARQADFEKTGYGQGSEFNPDVLYETMVRALVVTYLGDHGDAAGAERQLHDDAAEGWTWLPAVVERLRAARSSGPLLLDESLRRRYGELLLAQAAGR